MLETLPYIAALALARTPCRTEPIRMIVPFPAGGGVDFTGRIRSGLGKWGEAVKMANIEAG
jgi:tripartite-type tricarboxylate transporter receptor subunit TctC